VVATAGQGSSDQEIATQDVQSTFKVQVQRNMVLVRVIVRDSNGRPVSGLRKEDFRLFDNGKPQEIDQFALESSSRASAIARQAPGKESEGEAASEPGPANSMPGNYQALYFDDVQMKLEDIVHARDAADRYLAATLTPADRAGIFTSSGRGNLDFTDDRSKLHDALFKLRPRPVISTDALSCPDISDYQAYLIVEQREPFATDVATQEALRCCLETSGGSGGQQICSREAPTVAQTAATRVFNQWAAQSGAVLRGLEQVVRHTALMPGQHSVIFLSPGFLLYGWESQIAEITDRALRSGVVISTLNPRGLYTIIRGGDASSRTVIISQDLMGVKEGIITSGFSRAEEVLNNLAEDTGGQFFHNSNDLDTGFRQVGTISDVTYVLAFSPLNLKFDGRFHKLKVSLVNSARFTIQARRGYFAPKASVDAATKTKEEIQPVYGQTPGGQAPTGPAASTRAATAAQPPPPDKIVLKIRDESVTQGQLERFIQGLNPESQRALASQGRRALGDEFALMLLLSQDALSHHLDSTPVFQETLALRRRQLLATMAYQEVVRQSVVTPEEISKYFAAHQSEFEEVHINEVFIRKKPEGAKEGTSGLTAEEAKTRAEEIRKALSSGDDPTKVAEKYQVPDLVRVDAQPYFVRRGTLRADMDKVAFELKDGQVSEVFDVGQALVFFKVASHKAGELKNLSSQIENTLRQQKVKSTLEALKKNANIWMDDGYFAAPSQAGPQGAAKPPVLTGGPATPK
jgi:VWFA-related protein